MCGGTSRITPSFLGPSFRDASLPDAVVEAAESVGLQAIHNREPGARTRFMACYGNLSERLSLGAGSAEGGVLGAGPDLDEEAR